MAPKFGLDDVSSSNFDATLVLATMLVSQLHAGSRSQPPQEATPVHGESYHRTGSQRQQDASRANVSGHPSDHTRIWSELSGLYFYSCLNLGLFYPSVRHNIFGFII